MFTDKQTALLHFGPGDGLTREYNPACKIDIAEYRRMEQKEEQYAAEDAEIHRWAHGIKNEHALALRRAEEAGYANGVRDQTKEQESAVAGYRRDAEALAASWRNWNCRADMGWREAVALCADSLELHAALANLGSGDGKEGS